MASTVVKILIEPMLLTPCSPAAPSIIPQEIPQDVGGAIPPSAIVDQGSRSWVAQNGGKMPKYLLRVGTMRRDAAAYLNDGIDRGDVVAALGLRVRRHACAPAGV